MLEGKKLVEALSKHLGIEPPEKEGGLVIFESKNMLIEIDESSLIVTAYKNTGSILVKQMELYGKSYDSYYAIVSIISEHIKVSNGKGAGF